MDSTISELLNALTANKQTMIEQLHRLCQINSGTTNADGLALMRHELQQLFEPLADAMETRIFAPVTCIDMSGDSIAQTCGDALLIRKRPSQPRRVLLCGHMDTVYPLDSAFQNLTQIDENTLNGPGVADMKGGLLVMLHALTLFETMPAASSMGWDVLITADEEIGSPASAALLNELADHYQAALIYEPAMDAEGTLAKNRRGSGKFTLTATGRSAHVGRAFDEGRNAIAYLAEVIVAVHALNGQRLGVTVNVGKTAGGEALNMVPDVAVAKLDIRFSKIEEQLWIKQQLEAIIKNMKRNDYSLSLNGSFGRPVKRVCRGTERLFNRVQTIGERLDLKIQWQDSGGCCDGNNLAQRGLPVIDTLGVRGGCIHSPEEFILLDSLVERTALSALLLADLAQGGLEDLHS